MKKVLFISQYFYDYKEYGNTRFYEIATTLSNRNNDVTVMTSNTDFSTGQPKELKEYNINAKIKQFKLYLRGKSFLYRLISYFEFFLKSLLADFKKYDLVYASSPSIFTGLSGSIRKQFSKTKFVYEIRDPWPESFDRMNVSSFLKRVIYRLDYFNCKKADYIICLTPGIKRLIMERNSSWESKIHVIPNGVNNEIMSKNPIKVTNKKAKVVFAGTITEHSGVDKFLLLDKLEHKNFMIDIYGKGQYLDDFLDLIKDKDYINYKGHFKKNELLDILSSYEVGFTYSPEGIYRDIAYGTKLFDYLSSELFVLAFNNKSSDMGKLLTEYDNGIAVENDKQFISFFKTMDSKEINKKRIKSKELLNEKFIFTKNLNKFLDDINF